MASGHDDDDLADFVASSPEAIAACDEAGKQEQQEAVDGVDDEGVEVEQEQQEQATAAAAAAAAAAGGACSTGCSPVVGGARARSPSKKATPNPTPRQRARVEEGAQGKQLFVKE